MQADISLFYLINSGFNSNFFNDFMVFISETTYLVVFLTIMALFLKNREIFYKAVISIFLLYLTVYALKYGINEPRSYYVLNNLTVLVPMENEPSFPSGHTSIAFGLWAILNMGFKKVNIEKKYQSMISIIFLLWAFTVAFSRIYVGAHYPHDVLGGTFTGVFFGILFYKIADRIYRRSVNSRARK